MRAIAVYHKTHPLLRYGIPVLVFTLGTIATSCTQEIPNQFLLTQQDQAFSVNQTVNTKIDMLWVIDNSTSMESVQTKVRAGIQQFAQTYMQPTWDIRVAAITTDTYLADSTFYTGPSGQNSFLTTVIGGTSNYVMPYLNGSSHSYSGTVVPARSAHYYTTSSQETVTQFPLFSSFEPSAYTPPNITYNSGGTEKFNAGGMRIIDTKPQLGPYWSHLLVGNHDGAALSMCWDNDSFTPQFLYDQTACYHRDDPADSQFHTGTANCASPNTGNGETGPSQCVNTFANNTDHTGKPIISTIPPTGTPGDQTWINNLISEFEVNLTPSTTGSPSERPFQSVMQLMSDNETQTTAFFRPNSLRVIVFVGDEDDQTQTPDTNQYAYGTSSSYGSGVFAHYVTENGSAPYKCKKLYTAPNAGYYYPTDDSGYCVDPNWLLPVSTVKTNFDNFFHTLDGTTSSDPANYFVVAITTMNTSGLAGQGYTYITQRYPALVTAVGNGSLTLDITSSDYAPLLNQVGQVILTAKSQFTLQYPITSQADMIVSIVHADGSSTVLTNSQYTASGYTLTITDNTVISSFTSTDSLAVNYQPGSSY